MPSFRLIILWLMAATMLSGSVTAATRPRAIHPERDKIPADARRDAVLADLEAILIGPADSTSIKSRPYLSGRDGLCRREVITIKYAPKNVEKPDGALKPDGLSVSSQYHWLGYADTKTRPQWQKACEQLSATKVYWAYSPEDSAAEDALVALDRALNAVRRRQDFAVVCRSLEDDEAAAAPQDCTSGFPAAAVSVIYADRCSGPSDKLMNCSDLVLDDFDANIVIKYPRSSKESGSIVITMSPREIVTP